MEFYTPKNQRFFLQISASLSKSDLFKKIKAPNYYLVSWSAYLHFFGFNHFLEARAEISFIWSVRRQDKMQLKGKKLPEDKKRKALPVNDLLSVVKHKSRKQDQASV